jgi:hypothetical protein
MCRVSRLLALLLFVLTVTCLAGCADKAAPVPTAPTGVLSSSAAQTFDGCYTVQFQSTGYDDTPVVLTGDLEGTSVVSWDSEYKWTGKTVANSGTAVWTITGGVVPGLTGFQTAFDNRNIATDRPGSPAWVFENVGTHRATGGVRKANLSYKGTYTWGATPPIVHRYWGVICP